MNKWTLTLLLAALCILPATAQVNNAGSKQANTSLEVQVERAVTQARETSYQQKKSVKTDSLSVRELIAQEEQQAIQRQRTDFTHRDSLDEQETQELSTQELIAAEEELALIRNQKDNHASFEKYPYLLSPSYRRADEATQAKIRAQFNRLKTTDARAAALAHHGKTWARKVGL